MAPLRSLGAFTLLMGVWIWVAMTPGVAAQSLQRTLTLAEYQVELGRALTRLEQVAEDSAAATIQEIGRDLQSINSVLLPSGETVEPLPLWSVLDEPDATPTPFPTLDFAQAQVRATLAQLEAASTDNTAARLAILAEVFRRPEFNTPASWLDRLWRWLEQIWNRFFPQVPNPIAPATLSTAQRWVMWGVIGVGIAAIIWLLAYWLRKLIGAFVQQAERDLDPGASDAPRTSAEARAQAQVAAHSGQYRSAVRRLYLAALLQLSEQQWIDYERSLTNREVLRRIPPNSPIYPHLAPVIETFDKVWYGIHEPDRAAFLAYEADIDALAAVARQDHADPAATAQPEVPR